MRKLVLGMAAGLALGVASGANAAVMVTGATNLNSPNPQTAPNGVAVDGNTTTISFGLNSAPAGHFISSLTLNNPIQSYYSILVGSSSGISFTNATLAGILGTPGVYDLTPLGSNGLTVAYSLPETLIAGGNYLFTFEGDVPSTGGVVNGNITITLAPVPEPATWALMILGFGAIGYAMRRRRSAGLLQLA